MQTPPGLRATTSILSYCPNLSLYSLDTMNAPAADMCHPAASVAPTFLTPPHRLQRLHVVAPLRPHQADVGQLPRCPLERISAWINDFGFWLGKINDHDGDYIYIDVRNFAAVW